MPPSHVGRGQRAKRAGEGPPRRALTPTLSLRERERNQLSAASAASDLTGSEHVIPRQI